VLATTDVLPSLAVTMPLSARQTLRLSASQTLSRPEYRELSPVTYFDILGGQKLFGNLGLKRALIRNYDVRWEWYPSSGEVVSVALFAKQFVQPIERVLVQTSDASQPDATFVNANGADNYGIELELRRNLGTVLAALQPVTLFSNVTLMRSDIRPGNDSLSSLTNASRPMVGQSPYVVNAGLAYARRAGGFSATVLFNRSGRRIVEAGVLPLPDSYEEARSLLDANVQLPLWNRTTLKLDALNLLDAPHRMTQGGIERLWYRSGRTFGMGLTWSL
jgi:outer membrane receptor protein involved in Fe transport